MVRHVGRRVQISGPQQRLLDVQLSGPDDGPAIVFHTGTPSAGIVFEAHAQAGADRGLRHIAYSRPGYGRSGRSEGRTVADCVQDVTLIADELGIERFYTVGQSGGGPHALACAALLPERTIAAATIAGVAPWGAEGLDWLAGMGEENIEEFAAAQAGGDRLHEYLDQQAAPLLNATGHELQAGLGDLLSDVDRDALTGEFAEHLSTCLGEGLAAGVWGWFDDDVAFVGDWGFELDRISRPVSVWQGGQDRFVPFTHGQWLARHISGSRSRLHPEHGHLSLAVSSYGEILDDLLASAG
jgi:pimeloyl-ACP methyl ester carboxylesterase